MHYSFTGDITEILDEAFYVIEDVLGSDGLAIVGSIAAIVLGVFAVLGIIGYVIKSIAVSGIAKKFGKDNANLAWIPVFHDVFCMYVLSDVTAKTTFTIHPAIDERIENRSRRKSFYIYLFGLFILPFLCTFVSVIISLIPVLGSIASLVLSLVPAVVVATIRFVYLRDILDALRHNKAENQQSAIIVTAVSHFVPLVDAIYLLTLKKYEPLHPAEYCYEDGPGNPYGDPYANPYGNPYASGANPGGNPYAPGYDPNGPQQNNPYGAPAGNPYDTQQNNPYGAPAGNPNDTQQNNPYGAPAGNSYDTQQNNPYGAPAGNPYESQNKNPYSTGNTPYGGVNNPYANGNTNPYANGNSNPYANGNTNPYAGGNVNPYSAGNQNPYSAPAGSGAYGTPGNPPYGAPFTPPPAPEAQTPPEAPAPENPQSM